MNAKVENAKSLYLQAIRDGEYREAIESYAGDRYTQHSTPVRDGKEGFIEFFESFIERNPERDIRIERAFADGRHVFLHVYQGLGDTEWVTADFFDTDDEDRMIEHWDVITEYVAETPSGHTSTDGASEITDLDRTEQNKAVVRTLIEEVLAEGGDPTRIRHCISADRFVQHSRDLPDGLDPFAALLLDPGRSLFYDEIVLLVGAGNFVATLCKTRWDGSQFAHADLFRLEDGLIVEHWDVAEAVPDPADLVNSGKF